MGTIKRPATLEDALKIRMPTMSADLQAASRSVSAWIAAVASVEDYAERMERLDALVEGLKRGTSEVDDVLQSRIQTLHAEKARSEAALQRATLRTTVTDRIDDEKIARFGRLLSEKLENGDINAKRGYIGSVVTRIEVGKTMIRIVGQKDTLATMVQHDGHRVSGFVRRWRARRDSNS